MTAVKSTSSIAVVARIVLRRLVFLVITLLGASIVVYGALFLAPGSPVAAATQGRSLSPVAVKLLEQQYGLNKPLVTRYVDWLGGVVHGDFGSSIVFSEKVGHLLTPRLAVTFELVLYGAVILVLFGILLGTLAALRGALDKLVLFISTVGIATPSFVGALVLISLFAVKLGWFPSLGAGTGVGGRIYHLTLPAIALTVAGTMGVARVTRTSVILELTRDHTDTARARGIAPGGVLRRHVMRNAMVPIATMSGTVIANLFIGTVVVETAFGLNGLGALLVSSVLDKDFAVVLAITLILATAFMVATTVTDLLALWLDPRLRTEGTR